MHETRERLEKFTGRLKSLKEMFKRRYNTV
nr:MAG TPA: hypothetical protein [Caudoviricetes sp.]